MRKNTKRVVIGSINRNDTKAALKLDDLDLRIIASLVAGKSNKLISDELRIPLSTIQRRTRTLFEKGAVNNIIEPNFARLGLRKGVVHLYVDNADTSAIASKLAGVPGITSVAIHIGNSDIVGNIIYRDSHEVLNIIASCKHIDGVTKVIWSEEVYSMTSEFSEKKMREFFGNERM